ncbi:hypothetical protein HZA56_19130 [Candidatus Poribacteria bacterium]|nr:hypothetical protein [Candidatus Poribacteria bacterium]
MRAMRKWGVVLAVFLAAAMPSRAMAEEEAGDSRDTRIEELERAVRELVEQVWALKEEHEAEKAAAKEEYETLTHLSAQVEEMGTSPLLDSESWVNKFTLGGYGEAHANFEEGPSGDQFDIHRAVLYLGYDFSDWIKFHSETEIEHALVSSESDGELLFEQIYLDFLLSDPLNVRVGRVLTPLGIINKKHEPPTFYGVERPSFDRVIIPTTWSSDGVGIFGSLTPSLKYEAYVVGGLDGSGFNDLNGIRGGRIEERASLHEPAFTARLDYYPFALREVGYGQALRLGASTYAGGLDNGNEGDDPGVDGDIQIYSGDFEYTISRFDFRGVTAFENIDGAREIGNGAAEEIFGWYLEGGYHFWPEAWKKGKLAKSDAVAFVRYDDFDTQYDMPSGVERNPDGDRNEWTVGMSFYFLPNLVFKADYQFRDSEGDDPGDAFNLGLGWQF